ncbi:unnamed protein product [marine sediment metagenome]|uniref:Uncharacterized protein n=1 Tax=marine sediment metagenome TaxID=412755 RepID=X0XML8_9ZZZZ
MRIVIDTRSITSACCGIGAFTKKHAKLAVQAVKAAKSDVVEDHKTQMEKFDGYSVSKKLGVLKGAIEGIQAALAYHINADKEEDPNEGGE